MKKFMLVPQSPFPSPLTKKLSQLDEEMKAILENTELGEATKAMMYSKVLSQYLDVKRQMQMPQRIPIIEEGNPPPNKDVSKIAKPIPFVTAPEPSEQSIPGIDISIIPRVYRNRANNLINHLRERSNASWNERDELVVDGIPIPGSNIVDLLDDTVRSKRGPEPIGARAFHKVLEDSNVPQSLIGNKSLVKTVDSAFETPPSTPKRLSPLNANIKRLETYITPKSKKKKQTGRGSCRKRGVRNPVFKWESL